MPAFTEIKPTRQDYWRAIILFGQNVACYKFALAKSLLEFAEKQKTFVTLEELAEPFSQRIIEHLKINDKQSTSTSSRFLAACKGYIEGEVTKDQLITTTVKLGFANVIDAFHTVNRDETPLRFFTDERVGERKGIELTNDIFELAQDVQHVNLPHEVEARWRLVETAWSLNISRNLIAVQYDLDTQALYTTDQSLRRVSITSCRNALNGYQKGKCFYCFSDISIDEHSLDVADVDHFLPHTLKQFDIIPQIDGVWNLVLACTECNRGISGKFAKVPSLKYLNRLYTRNEFLINSHHPLRETLIQQTGASQQHRVKFLDSCYTNANKYLIHTWEPSIEYEPNF